VKRRCWITHIWFTRHPVTGTPLHADFYVLRKGKKLKIKIPVIRRCILAIKRPWSARSSYSCSWSWSRSLPKDFAAHNRTSISSRHSKNFLVSFTPQDIKLSSGVTLIAGTARNYRLLWQTEKDWRRSRCCAAISRRLNVGKERQGSQRRWSSCWSATNWSCHLC